MSNKKAVIYARVSGASRFVKVMGWLLRKPAAVNMQVIKKYDVVEVFHDEGVTGKLLDRPQMQAMLTFLKSNRTDELVVIIDDISRLARDIETHIHLRTAIDAAGGKLESPSIEFGDDSDSRLVEHLLASVAAHQREKNAETTFNRMRARMQNGYWVFKAPIGYQYEKTSQGKMLVPDEKYAPLLMEALEGYASGRFEAQVEVKRFLESRPEYPKNKKTGKVHQQRVTDLLTHPVYAGYISHEDWGVKLTKGKHEGLISLETWQKIQERRKGVAKAPARKDIREDFPLRGFVTCGDCGKPLTACWSKGKLKKYAYYLCDHKGCVSYRKSIPRDKLEGAFQEVLLSLQPTERLFKLAKAMFKDAWNIRLSQSKEIAALLKRDIAKLEKQTGQFLDRIVETDNHAIIRTYETRITRLERDKLIALEKLEKTGKPAHSFEKMFEHACAFLSSPCKIWESGQFNVKRIVLRTGI